MRQNPQHLKKTSVFLMGTPIKHFAAPTINTNTNTLFTSILNIQSDSSETQGLNLSHQQYHKHCLLGSENYIYKENMLRKPQTHLCHHNFTINPKKIKKISTLQLMTSIYQNKY